MGQRGPIPRREATLARPRERKGSTEQGVKRGELREFEWLEPDPDWAPIAIQMYEAIQASGQADFYQASDAAFAWSVCDDLSWCKNQNRKNGQIIQAVYNALGSLLVTEGDRRRVRVELMEPESDEKPADLIAIDSYKARLSQ